LENIKVTGALAGSSHARISGENKQKTDQERGRFLIGVGAITQLHTHSQ
jgi:hypothetical protein